MHSRPYFPAREAEFVDWSQNLITVSEAHASEWNLPAPRIQELRLLHDEFQPLHVLCNTASYTRVDMEKKNEKKAALIHLEEIFVRIYFAVRWEGNSGKKGLWSEVYSANVP